MSANNTNQINKKIEIPKLKLWLIWLSLFVLPSLATVIGFKYYSKEYLYFNDTDLTTSAFETIRRYNSSIIPENFMEEQIDRIKHLDSNNSIEALKDQIDSILCGKTMLCVFFDENVNKLSIPKNNKNDLIKNIHPNFIKLYLKKFINSINNSNNNSNNTQIYTSAQNQLGIALQQMFKTITNITISNNKVSKNYSLLFGGELYFILCEFKKPNKENIGFFAVMRGKDFSFHKMLKHLHQDYQNIRIIFKEIDINKSTEKPEIFHSGIKQTAKGLYIIAPTSIIFARHVLHGGTDELIKEYNHLVPMIEYRVPIEKDQQIIKKWTKQINYLAIIIILFSAIGFLHISLFGFNERLSFKNKIVLLIVLSSLFPFAVFTIGVYSIKKYNQFIKLASIKQHAETEIQLTNQELNHYLTEIETKMASYSLSLSELLSKEDLKPQDFSNYVDFIGENVPASSVLVYIDPIPDYLKDIIKKKKTLRKSQDKSSKELLDEENDAISSIVPSALLEAINDNNIPKPSERKRKDTQYIYGNPIEITLINDLLIDNGKIKAIKKYNIPICFIFNYLHSKKYNSFLGIIITKYEPRAILNSFFKNSLLKKKEFKEIKDNYEIKYAFLPTEDSGSAKIWEEGTNSISPEDKNTVLKTPQSEMISLNNKTIIKRKNQKIPHLAVAVITDLNKQSEGYFIITLLVSVLAYLSLIFYFANKLLDIMFVEPVMLLASNANAIARGSDKWDAEIKSGDEFEDLNEDFKNLVVGLKERNILKSYVSEDALSDIEETDSLKLLPGGEYLEATIVFSAIKDYEKITESLKPEEIIKLLSSYISIGEDSSKKYGGSLDKILSDTIMLVFREDPNKTSHGLRAAQAALDLVKKAKEINLPGLYTGIASGRVISGKIGSYSGKLDFTVIGNPVNLAARFKAEAKKGTDETGIIISGTTIGLIKGKANVKFLRRCSIKRKAREYNIYELLSLRD